MYFHRIILVIFIIFNFCNGQQPADKGANAKTKEILDFIAGLPKQGKYLSGQFVGVSGIHYNLSQINAIENLTGHVPSILGCDYSNGWGHAIPPQKLLNYSCEVGPHTTNGQFDYSLWPIAIQNRFNLITYFFAWSGPWSPIENKNAYELFNNIHVINRDQI